MVVFGCLVEGAKAWALDGVLEVVMFLDDGAYFVGVVVLVI
jgi:hypothetical protein